MSAPQYGASTFIWVSPFSSDTLELIDKVAEVGFDLIEICIEDPAGIDTDAIGARLAQVGIDATVCGAFGPDRDVSSDDPQIRAMGLAYIKTCTDIATALGANMVAGPMYSSVGKTEIVSREKRAQQWDWAAEALGDAGTYAAQGGVRLAIEPLNRFETDLINTVAQGLDLVSRIDCPNVGLLLDTFHMNIEEQSIPDAIRLAGDKLFHFHACASDRGVPGRDHLPWSEIAKALGDASYSGPWVIEAFNPTITEIAKAVSLWRPLAETQDAIAFEGLAHLRAVAKACA